MLIKWVKIRNVKKYLYRNLMRVYFGAAILESNLVVFSLVKNMHDLFYSSVYIINKL